MTLLFLIYDVGSKFDGGLARAKIFTKVIGQLKMSKDGDRMMEVEWVDEDDMEDGVWRIGRVVRVWRVGGWAN